MSIQSFISLVSGKLTQLFPTQISAGTSSAGNIVALNNLGVIDSSMIIPTTVLTTNAVASETILAGAIVNIWDNAGVPNLRNADNTAVGKTAHGYAPSAITSGATGIINLQGLNNLYSSLTPGSYYYLGTIGTVTITAPSTTGNVEQIIGVAVNSTTIAVQILSPITV